MTDQPTKRNEMDLSQAPPDCPNCYETEWADTRNGVAYTHCFFCGRIASVPGVIPDEPDKKGADNAHYDAQQKGAT